MRVNSSVLSNGTTLGDKVDVIAWLGLYTHLWPEFCKGEVAEFWEGKMQKYEETKKNVGKPSV